MKGRTPRESETAQEAGRDHDNAVTKMVWWGGLPKGRVGSDTQCPPRGTDPNLPGSLLHDSQLGKPVAPRHWRYPDRKEGGRCSGQRRTEKAKAVR